MRIGIIGGGLAGLTVAFRRIAAGDEVVLFEKDARLGGQLWTEHRDGFVIEHGAEGFVARGDAVEKLAGDLGRGGDLVAQNEGRSLGWDGALRVLSPGEAAAMLGFTLPKEEQGRGVRTFVKGMAEITDALAASIRGAAELRLGVTARPIEASSRGWRVPIAGGAGAVIEEVDAVVVATTAAAASRLLAPAFGAAATALAAAPTLSSLTVTLGYPRSAIAHPLDATGFIAAPSHQEEGLRACTFTTTKFDGRAPEGDVSLRVFFRPSPEDLAALDDAAWIRRAEAALARVLGVRAPPRFGSVARWPDALPIFEPRHAARVRALEDALAGRRVHLAGAAFSGSGVEAAVRSAEAAAAALG